MLSAFWSMAAHQGWLVKFERVYDDYGYRSSLEQTRAGSPPRWVRVADLACTPGLSYEVTLSGRNLGGWSPLSEPLQTGCFLRPGIISDLREVSSSVSADRETASLTLLRQIHSLDAFSCHVRRLAWNAPQDAAGAETAYYNVYRDRGLRQALFELIGSTAVTQFDDAGLVPGRDYGYQVAGTPVIETPKVDLLGILNQAGLQMIPIAQTGELDQVDGVLQVYSSDAWSNQESVLQNAIDGAAKNADPWIHREPRGRLPNSNDTSGVSGLSAQVEVDLAGTTAEGDPCLEAELEIAAPAVSMQFCAGDSDSAPSISLAHGQLATIFWRTGQLSSPPTETGRKTLVSGLLDFLCLRAFLKKSHRRDRAWRACWCWQLCSLWWCVWQDPGTRGSPSMKILTSWP
eukprot:s3183_g6.t1